MLAQSVNAISRRFQNQRADTPRDPLAHFELDPLRPLNNILWGYVQDEYKRLTVPRRSQEYNHQYGLVLFGKANPQARAADPRSKFLESFHNLLHRASQFFKEDNDTTVIADGFPLLNALREVHLVLAQGAHNQFGDLPWTARVEMLMQEWIMARQETRDFLQSRVMVPYTEAWMPQVDTMKSVQGWTDVGVNHFRDLGVYGEQLLLSIRYGDWIDINDEDVAKNWARSWRPEIQSYLHSYRAVSGVDLTNPDSVDYTVPAVHLKRRLDAQAQSTITPHPSCSISLRPCISASITGPAMLPVIRLRWVSRPRLKSRPEPVVLGRRLAALIGCPAALLAPSTLHLFWDLCDWLGRKGVTFCADRGIYPVIRMGLERAAAKGAEVLWFAHHDPDSLGRQIARARGRPGRRHRWILSGLRHSGAAGPLSGGGEKLTEVCCSSTIRRLSEFSAAAKRTAVRRMGSAAADRCPSMLCRVTTS